VTCAFLVVAITVPAISGAGFYLAPAAILMAVAAVLGLVVLIRDWRAATSR
jgi:hypothetical protein